MSIEPELVKNGQALRAAKFSALAHQPIRAWDDQDLATANKRSDRADSDGSLYPVRHEHAGLPVGHQSNHAYDMNGTSNSGFAYSAEILTPDRYSPAREHGRD